MDVVSDPVPHRMDENPQGMDENWDRLHEQARFRPRYPSEAVIRFVMRHVGEASAGEPKLVLDLGAGAGRHSVLVSDLGHRVVAFDYSIEGLRHARAALSRLGRAALVVRGTMQRLPLRSESVDAAIAYGVLYYADRRGFEAGVSELRRVLKKGGHLLVVTRTTRDGRYGRGREIEPNTFVLADDSTNELGMPGHFIDRKEVDELFSEFTDVMVDWQDQTLRSGTFLNSDWIIDAMKPS